MVATYESAEPGVIFIDRINALNNLSYCEDHLCDQPMRRTTLARPYGACLLGSINLAKLVDRPFTEESQAGRGAIGQNWRAWRCASSTT